MTGDAPKSPKNWSDANGQKAPYSSARSYSSARPYGSNAQPPRTRPKGGAVITTPQMKRVRYRKRSWALFIAPIPLIFAAFTALMSGNVVMMAVYFALYGAFAGGALMLREGLEAEEEYARKAFAAPPGLPRKTLGGILTGAATGLTALASGWLSFIPAVLIGLFAAGAYFMTFGFDPIRRKGEISVAGITAKALDEALNEARDRIASLVDAGSRLKDNGLRERVMSVAETARNIVTRIEEDPNDLRRARKFLRVYLQGSVDATEKYARSQDTLDDSEMYIKYRGLLSEMETTFARQYETLLINDRADLDVEIEVLAERLKEEAVR